MAYVSQSAPVLTGAHRFFSGLIQVFAGFGTALELSRSYDERMRYAEKLQAKTDDELAQLGLKRDEIMRHVFAEIFELDV